LTAKNAKSNANALKLGKHTQVEKVFLFLVIVTIIMYNEKFLGCFYEIFYEMFYEMFYLNINFIRILILSEKSSKQVLL